MKASLKHIFVALLLCSLSGCGIVKSNHHHHNSDLSLSKYDTLPNRFQNNKLHFKISIDQEAPKELILVIENLGSQQITFGTPYSIEKWHNHHWYVIPLKKNMGFTAIGILLAPQKQYRQSIDKKNLVDPLAKGHYRLVKKIESEVVAAAFEIH
ncbi:outer membrane protein assembly factor BamE (lipoprotein component of BamABCDE complex) [Pullulanibacillus pueri]|uniref:Bacterial Ig-like domain-containing protein n=1 Tax=Pullulanibacillus pueri TaxID=1437324 RepID=A0A8J2ZW56_9BACL|nr:immunoglobulin-like domain-containing protein [Pullulanibacillus pueri]MBM7682373.1 outer membrane protein assembly factor BamE (lipoprotein component of BamABCDE complex) [Pullulanibacillus pueri]GGH81893.1 hypothetical protein GCM10007096_20470 [Pullulanibacillus pueri]